MNYLSLYYKNDRNLGAKMLIKMIAGTFGGLVVGMLIGRVLIFEFDGTRIDLEIPLALVGALIGYLVMMIVGKMGASKGNSEKPAKQS